jgi:hypothetical protein
MLIRPQKTISITEKVEIIQLESEEESEEEEESSEYESSEDEEEAPVLLKPVFIPK